MHEIQSPVCCPGVPLNRFLLLFPLQAICQLLTEVQAYFDAAVAVLQVIWCSIAGVST